MIEILRDLVEVYAFVFLTGYGTYRLVVPDFLRTRALCATLVPGIGFAQLSIAVAYSIYFDMPIRSSLLACAIAGIATLLLCTIVRKPILPRDWRLLRARRPTRDGLLTVFFALVATGTLLAVLAPVLAAGFATTPYRSGVDQVGYSESAQYLLEGGTLGKLRSRLLTELETSSLTVAKQQNNKDVRFESYVDSEFLLKARRWGYPGALAAMTALTRNDHVFRLAFILLIIEYSLTLALVYQLTRVANALPRVFAVCVTLATALNCNMLNVYYEGQYAQIFATPFLLIFLAIYLRARSMNNAERSRHSLIAFTATSALTVAALFSAFNESLVLLVATIAVIVVLDLIFYRTTNLVALGTSALGFLGGAALAWPLSQSWLTYTVANLSGLARAGFWQPHWASLAEILGLGDMYVTRGYTLVARSPWDAGVNATLSILAAFVIARLFLRSKSLDRSFWLAPFILILAEYVKSRYVDDILNYPYMKMYSAFIPLVSIVGFVALYRFCRQFGRNARWIPYAAASAVVLVGSGYITRFLAQSQVVTPEMFALYSSGKDRRFDDFAFLTNDSSIQQFMYVPLLSMHWLDQPTTQKFLAPILDKKVLLVVWNRNTPCRQCMATYFAGNVVYEDSSVMFIDSELPVRTFCDHSVLHQNVDALGLDGQKQFVDETRAIDGTYLKSYRQCDYGYLDKLAARAARSEE